MEDPNKAKKRLAIKTAAYMMIPGLIMIAFGTWLLFDTLGRDAGHNYENIDAQEAMILMEEWEDELVIVDVRDQEEFARGHISGSINIPLPQLVDGRYTQLNRSQLVLLISRDGQLSKEAAQYLVDQDYPFVYNLEGGIQSWPGDLE